MSSIDFNEIFTQQMAKAVAEGQIDHQVRKVAADAIRNAIISACSGYSAAGKALTEKIQQAVQVSIEQVDLRTHTGVMAEVISDVLNAMLREQAADIIKRKIAERLDPAPAEITTEKLLGELVAMLRDRDIDNDDRLELDIKFRAGVLVTLPGTWMLTLSRPLRRYESGLAGELLQFSICQQDRTIQAWSYNQRLNRNPLSFMGHGIDAYLYKLIVRQTVVTDIGSVTVDDLDHVLQAVDDD